MGDTLRRERVRRGLTPKEAADSINLPKGTVVGLEAATLPLDDVPTRASLRIYARSFGVDSEAFLRRLPPAQVELLGSQSAVHGPLPV